MVIRDSCRISRVGLTGSALQPEPCDSPQNISVAPFRSNLNYTPQSPDQHVCAYAAHRLCECCLRSHMGSPPVFSADSPPLAKLDNPSSGIRDFVIRRDMSAYSVLPTTSSHLRLARLDASGGQTQSEEKAMRHRARNEQIVFSNVPPTLLTCTPPKIGAEETCMTRLDIPHVTTLSSMLC